MPVIRLNTGRSMPLLGYGTYQIPNGPDGIAAIKQALSSGYNLLDCASFYKNEKACGSVIASKNRSELYIISKVWNDAIFEGEDAIRKSCINSISDLYVLLIIYCVHVL